MQPRLKINRHTGDTTTQKTSESLPRGVQGVRKEKTTSEGGESYQAGVFVLKKFFLSLGRELSCESNSRTL